MDDLNITGQIRYDFDGLQLKVYEIRPDNSLSLVTSWDAISGKLGFQSPDYQNLKDAGPIPEGVWEIGETQEISLVDDVIGTASFGQAGAWPGGTYAWGSDRAWLSAVGDTDTLERSGFSIHGGIEPGSAGCIDLMENSAEFMEFHRKYGEGAELHVTYDESLSTSPHPIAAAIENGTYYVNNILEVNPEAIYHPWIKAEIIRHEGEAAYEAKLKEFEASTKDVRCFSAGTLIDMADGSQKPIEQIKVGDEVLSYDPAELGGLGELKAARVTRTMVNQVEEIIDFHGVKMTPGHATLCGDGPHQGQHIPIMDILVADGAIVNREGELIRAATNLPVGSEGDRFVKVAYILDKSQKTYSHGRIRIGTRMIGQDGGDDWRVMEALEREGYVLHPDGLISKGGETPHPLYWFGPLPKPEDYVLAKSRLTIGNLYSGQNVESSSAIGADLPRYAGMTVQ